MEAVNFRRVLRALSSLKLIQAASLSKVKTHPVFMKKFCEVDPSVTNKGIKSACFYESNWNNIATRNK